MTTPPSKLVTPPASPTVCDCGYELTGLVLDHESKCPECGLLVRQIVGSRSIFANPWVVAAMILSPGLSSLLFGLASGVSWAAGMPWSPFVLIVLVWILLLLVVSLPVCISLAISLTGKIGGLAHAVLSVCIVPIAIAANLVLTMMTLYLIG